MGSIIKFYRTGDEYGCFSNFAAYSIEVDGLEWPTSEHYFQAQKFSNAEQREKIRQTPSPMIAARLG
ncbi:MAG TPA: NADAR family protein, partial [Verrucomicrobiae bacterium]|nr:NADAR family protein [Verrucomicrobiae bacterium]